MLKVKTTLKICTTYQTKEEDEDILDCLGVSTAKKN